jgi:hypothetical protein
MMSCQPVKIAKAVNTIKKTNRRMSVRGLLLLAEKDLAFGCAEPSGALAIASSFR